MTTNLKSAVKLKSASNGEGLEHDDQQLVQPESSTYKGLQKLIGLLLHNVRVHMGKRMIPTIILSKT